MFSQVFLLFCLFSPFVVHAQTPDAAPSDSSTPPSKPLDLKQLDRRLRNLERKADTSFSETEENDRNVKSYLNTKLEFGGFFETAVTAIGENYRNVQVAAASNTLGINLGAEFSDNLRFASQFLTFLGLPLENPNSNIHAQTLGLPAHAQFQSYSFATLLTQAYLEWSSNEAFSVQVGMGYVPFGYVFQQFEPVLFVRRDGPQLLGASDLVFPLWEGFHLHGQFPLKSAHWGYDVYTFSPQSNPTILGLGERLWWKSSDDNLGFGVSSQTAKRDTQTYDTLGTDIRFHWKRFTLTSECAKSFANTSQPWSFYVEPDFDLSPQSVILYTFADYLVNPLNSVGTAPLSVSDPFQKWEYGTGINWLPTAFTRLRAGITLNQYVGASAAGQSRNYWDLDLSAGVAF